MAVEPLEGAADPKTQWETPSAGLEGSCESSCWIRDVSTRMVTQLCFVRLELHDRNFVSGAFSQADRRNCVRGNLCASRISSESNLTELHVSNPSGALRQSRTWLKHRSFSELRQRAELRQNSSENPFVTDKPSSENGARQKATSEPSSIRSKNSPVIPSPCLEQIVVKADRPSEQSIARVELRPRHSARLVSVEQELCQVGLRRNGDSSNRTSSAATREVRQNGTVSEWSFVRAES